MVSFVILFAPCIFVTVLKAYYSEREQQELKTQVTQKLSTVTYARIGNTDEQQECAICLENFEQ